MKRKRIFSYIIDMMIVFLLLFAFMLLIRSNNVRVLETELQTINEQLVTHDITFSAYLNHYSIIVHDLDKERVWIQFIGIVLMILYFIIIPYFNKGRTLGKQLFRIQIYKEKITMNDYIFRTLLINGLGYMLLSVLCIYVLPSFSYFITISFLGMIQLLFVGTSFLLLVTRQDGRSLEDMITGSRVERYNEVKK